MPARPKCPDCYVQLRVKERPDSRWRYCEECGWDERGKFEVTVWGDEGDIEKKLWEADADEVAAVEEQYGHDPFYVVQVERRDQRELS